MKYLITESQLDNFLKKKLGFDINDTISMITSVHQIPKLFLENNKTDVFKWYLNQYGPMYLVKTPEDMFLCQKNWRDGDGNINWTISNSQDITIGERQLMKLLGIDVLGLSLDDLVNEVSEDFDN